MSSTSDPCHESSQSIIDLSLNVSLNPSPDFVLVETRPNRADAVKNRQLLLDTAARLFKERGVEHITMSEIAQAANVGKGTLYRHFNNKTELCFALLDQDQRELQEATLRRLRLGNPPSEDLAWFLEQVAGFVVRNIDLLYVSDGGAPPSLNNQAHSWWRQTIRALLGRMAIVGDLEYLADTFYVMLDAPTLRYQVVTQGYDLVRVVRGLHYLADRITA